MDKVMVTSIFLLVGLSLASALGLYVLGFLGAQNSVRSSPYLSVEGSDVLGWGTLVYFRVVMPSGEVGEVVRVFEACGNSSLDLLNATTLKPLFLPFAVNYTYSPRLAVVVPPDCSKFCVAVNVSSGYYVLCSS